MNLKASNGGWASALENLGHKQSFSGEFPVFIPWDKLEFRSADVVSLAAFEVVKQTTRESLLLKRVGRVNRPSN